MTAATEPWLDPKPGDKLVFPDGVTRTIVSICGSALECHAVGRHFDPKAGRLRAGARSGPCQLSTWIDNCRKAIAGGGRYRRDPRYVPAPFWAAMMERCVD